MYLSLNNRACFTFTRFIFFENRSHCWLD